MTTTAYRLLNSGYATPIIPVPVGTFGLRPGEKLLTVNDSITKEELFREKVISQT